MFPFNADDVYDSFGASTYRVVFKETPLETCSVENPCETMGKKADILRRKLDMIILTLNCCKLAE